MLEREKQCPPRVENVSGQTICVQFVKVILLFTRDQKSTATTDTQNTKCVAQCEEFQTQFSHGTSQRQPPKPLNRKFQGRFVLLIAVGDCHISSKLRSGSRLYFFPSPAKYCHHRRIDRVNLMSNALPTNLGTGPAQLMKRESPLPGTSGNPLDMCGSTIFAIAIGCHT